MADSSPQHGWSLLEGSSLVRERTYVDIVLLRDNDICKLKSFAIFIAEYEPH